MYGTLVFKFGSQMDAQVHEIILRPKSEGLDFSIRGGKEHGIPIVVSSVQPGGLAAEAGLDIGSEIVSVNGISLRGATHAGAVQMLAESSVLKLKVKPNRLLKS